MLRLPGDEPGIAREEALQLLGGRWLGRGGGGDGEGGSQCKCGEWSHGACIGVGEAAPGGGLRWGTSIADRTLFVPIYLLCRIVRFDKSMPWHS